MRSNSSEDGDGIHCVILAGGLGTRMHPQTETLPKNLISVGGRPFVDHQLEWLAAEGVRHVVLSVGYRGGLVREFVGNGSRWGLEVVFVDEGDDLRGTAGAVRLAIDEGALPDAFMVLYGDSYLRVSVREVWRAFLDSGYPALMTVLHNENRWDRSNVVFDGHRVVRYDKAYSAAEMQWVDYGLSALRVDVIDDFVKKGGKGDLAEVFNQLSVAGRLAGYEAQERFFEIGSHAGLAALEDYLTRSTAGDGVLRTGEVD